MARQSKTGIAWTDETWNPLRGCSPDMKCAPTCWAEKMAHRHRKNPKYAGFTQINKCGPEWSGKVALIQGELEVPLRMRRPRRIAVGLMGDWMRLTAHDIDKILAVEALCPQHQFLHLTKCAREMREYLTYHFRVVSPGPRERVFGIVQKMPGYDPEHPKWTRLAANAFDIVPFPNVWIGVSCLDQSDADAAREPMRQIAAAGWFTWVSHEPAWRGIDWRGWDFLRYMVSGGQSGAKARPSHPDWFRADRDWCAKHGIPWMFKQWGEWAPREWKNDHATHAVRASDGHVVQFSHGHNSAERAEVATEGWQAIARVGKRAAGRLLDGREYLELPEVQRG